jgi:hypothetical protein
VDPELYAKAKALFIELVEKSPKERERALKGLEAEQPELARTVRDLLASHVSRTLFSGATGKASDTTTQSKSISTIGIRRISSNLVGGTLPILLAVAATLLLYGFSAYLHWELYKQTRDETKIGLESMAEQKAVLLVQWVRGNELRLDDWGKQRELQQCVQSLNTRLQDANNKPQDRKESLATAPEHATIKRFLDNLVQNRSAAPRKKSDQIEPAVSDLKFAIWNRSMILISDWQYENPDVDLGGIATPIGASFLMQAFDTQKTTVELPRPTADTISKEYPLEANGQYLMFFVPIFSPQDPSEVMAVMMVRSELFLADLQALISASVHSESNCYLLDDRGSIATHARDLDQLEKLPVFAENRVVHGTHVMEARDPGGDLLAGFIPRTAQEEWAWTKPGKTVSLSKNGSDMEGYRDYRGKNVVGAWHWIEPLQRLLVLELPKETAYKTLGFIDRAFRIVYSIPLAVALVLGLLSLRRSFTKMDLTNKSIGAYKLKEKIGEGGLGIVYKAEHLLLGRTAAIKLIKEPFANAGAMRRFEREVRLAARLSHPNTVSIYDFGVSTNGLPYCAMELVEGVNLAYFIGYDPSISADRCVWLLRQICGAIEEAHESGLIHRDIKPQNIMVCQRGQLCDLVKVVDFGLAKTMADNVSRDVTATRVLIGTPGFIAPERLETPWIADPRIDIFAFGVLGVYLLSCKVPVLGATHQSLLQQLQLGRFRDLCADKYFSSLVALLACCMAPDPVDRPRSMSEVGTRLESIASFLPWNENLAERWWRDNGNDLLAFSRTQQIR